MPKSNTSRAGSAACLHRSGNATSDGDVVFRDTFFGDDGSCHDGAEIAHDVFRPSVRVTGKAVAHGFGGVLKPPDQRPCLGFRHGNRFEITGCQPARPFEREKVVGQTPDLQPFRLQLRCLDLLVKFNLCRVPAALTQG